MKKLLLILALSLFLFDVSAQTKTAYCDVYARGGGKHMRITIMYNNTPYEMYPNGNRSNLGNVLNVLASNGWVLDRDIVIPRHPLHSTFTRHKLHLIMKKEYQEGENPFLLFENDRPAVNDEPIITASELNEKPLDNTISDELTEDATTADYVITVSKCDSNGTWYDAIEYCKQVGLSPLRIQPLENGKHVFSHVEWHMVGYRVRVDELEKSCTEKMLFVHPEEIQAEYPIPAAFETYTKCVEIKLGQEKYKN